MEKVQGCIFNIQKFSVHDGAGIRDVVFLKGCPLRCQWCSNPESQATEPEYAYNRSRCLGSNICGYCIKSCPNKAMEKGPGTTIRCKKEFCKHCGRCVVVCPTKARKQIGEYVTAEEVYRRTQDQKYTWRVNGGVTISGGEPLMQIDFLCRLLKKYKEVGIHTAIETSGYAPWEDLHKAAELCDCIFYDIKLMDPEKHKKYTGVDNMMIKANLHRLRQLHPSLHVTVRTPIIPSVNDDMDNLRATAEFLRDIGGVDDYELLPYHKLGEAKYRHLGREYFLKGIQVPDKESISRLNEVLRKICVRR